MRRYDMHGNVLERCRDWYGVLPGGQNPEGAKWGREKVNRGGNWESADAGCRSGRRYKEHPELKKSGFGFRVARSHTARGED